VVLWALYHVLAAIAGAMVLTMVVLLVWLMVESGLLWLAVVLGAFLVLSFVYVLRGKAADRAAARRELERTVSGLP
jgi:hypothetical protein